MLGIPIAIAINAAMPYSYVLVSESHNVGSPQRVNEDGLIELLYDGFMTDNGTTRSIQMNLLISLQNHKVLNTHNVYGSDDNAAPWDELCKPLQNTNTLHEDTNTYVGTTGQSYFYRFAYDWTYRNQKFQRNNSNGGFVDYVERTGHHKVFAEKLVVFGAPGP